MDNTKLIIIAVLGIIMIDSIIIMIFNTKKSNLKKKVEEINIRFNAVKSEPIAFKLNKAQAMAKRNEETAAEVNEYHQKYAEAQKHMDEVQQLIETLEDQVALKQKKEARESIDVIDEQLIICEEEIRNIEDFLDKFQEVEKQQRDYSLRLKEEFRELKLYISDNANAFAFANEGVEQRIAKCESLFSASEEWMYANDYAKSRENLDEIAKEIKDMKAVCMELPSLIQEAKGVLPILLEEVDKEYALTRQRGIYTDHLKIEEKVNKIRKSLHGDLKTLSGATVDNVKEHSLESKEQLEDILANLEKENVAYKESKEVMDSIKKSLEEINKIHEYVSKSYALEKEHFGLDDFKPFLVDEKKKIKEFELTFNKIIKNYESAKEAASVIVEDANHLFNDIEAEKDGLMAYKLKIDQTSSDESRATTQLQKLQVVVNEIEVKVKEYRLPTISSNYYDDLRKTKNYIVTLKEYLNEIPIDITKLNSFLDEAIDFIYTFYNNVNNIVGMAIMVENAIVFGNKYRSTYPEIDTELSKAEFSYLNGEYTKALTIAITCMENIIPNIKDDSYLETA